MTSILTIFRSKKKTIYIPLIKVILKMKLSRDLYNIIATYLFHSYDTRYIRNNYKNICVLDFYFPNNSLIEVPGFSKVISLDMY